LGFSGAESTARASFYFYNIKTELDRFVGVVKEIQKFSANEMFQDFQIALSLATRAAPGRLTSVSPVIISVAPGLMTARSVLVSMT
jgi:hypothetical protein